MKKILFVAAATMLGLSSCSDNEVFNTVEKSKTPISVNVYSQSQTRAMSETTLDDLKEGFKFMAVGASKTYIEETTVSMQNDAWDYGTTAYWPATSEAIKFYGIYPTDCTLYPANDKATIAIDGDTDVVASYSSKSLNDSPNGNVSLSFSHVLGQVMVSVMGDKEGFDYTVTSLTITTPSAVDYKFSNGTTTAAANTQNTELPYLADAQVSAPYNSDGIFKDLDDYNILALPAVQLTLDIEYTVSSQIAGDLPLKKSAVFTPEAGKKNRVYLTLPNSRTAMSFSVDAVDIWDDNDVVEHELPL